MTRKFLALTLLVYLISGCGGGTIRTAEEFLNALQSNEVAIKESLPFDSDALALIIQNKYQAKIHQLKLSNITVKIYECRSAARAKWIFDQESSGKHLVESDDGNIEVFAQNNNLLLSIPQKEWNHPDYIQVRGIFMNL